MGDESKMGETTPEKEDDVVISFFKLRKSIGFLGIALPFAVAIIGPFVNVDGIASSISSYYHFPVTGTIFVGTLCAQAVFFYSYLGPKNQDALWSNLASVFALGVAFFPTARDLGPPPDALSTNEKIASAIHITSATLFFLTLAYFSLCLFTKSDDPHPTEEKLMRNRIYRVSGYVMLFSLGIILIVKLLQHFFGYTGLDRFDPVFWFEALATVAFGFSWFTKGEGILKDRQPAASSERQRA